MPISIRRWFEKWHWMGGRSRQARQLASAACLTIGLATAWPAQAEATTVRLDVTPTDTISDAYVVLTFPTIRGRATELA